MKNLISSYALSNTGVSVSTGIIVDKIIENNLDLKYDYWFINLYTLVRNYIDTIDMNTDEKIKLLKSNNYTKLIEDMADDINLTIDKVPVKLEVYVYRPSYKKIKLPNLRTKDSFKGFKYVYLDKQEKLVDLLLDKLTFKVVKRDHTLPYLRNTLITTHITLDLLNYKNKSNIDLIESHTAEIKDRKKWYTKLYKLPNKDMSIIPFTEKTLYIFGDRHLIAPLNIKLRKKIYDLGLKYHWNQSTTESRVIANIKFADPILGKMILDMKNYYY